MGKAIPGNFTEKYRKTLITQEKIRLSKIFEGIETKSKETIESLIDEAAFMKATLEETRGIIIREGVIESYQNGANQSGLKKSSAVEVYDKMLNTYSKVIKQLCDIITASGPADKTNDPKEELLKFLSETKRR